MKRKLTLFLSAAVAMSSLPMTAYAANFKDIGEVAWAAATINEVADKGLLSGYQDGTFRGKNNVTYPEAMQMLYNALVKSGKVDPIDAVTAYKYVPTLNTYKVPGWSQMAVAYALENGIISMQDMVSKFALGNKYATREDVAYMFGQALAVYYDVDGTYASLKEFIDYYNVAGEKAPLVDLLKRLEIVSGDTSKRFHPTANINRAEMAVMLNKTFSILDEGVSGVATITEATNNKGTFFYFEMEFENGKKQGFYAQADGVKVYDADHREMSLARLSKGDEVRLDYNGDMLKAIYVLDAVSAQSKYDITGYITNYKENQVTIENENTGETDKYTILKDCICFIDGVKVSRTELEKSLKENYDKHAYAGLMTVTNREKEEQGGTKVWVDVLEVVEIHVDYTDDYTLAGKVDDLDSKGIQFTPVGVGSKRDVKYADECEFYIDDKEVDMDDALELADSGTVYAKVTLDKKDKAVKIVLSEEEFEDASTKVNKEEVVEVKAFSDTKIKVEGKTETTTYRFGSDNPVSNIDFMKWNTGDDDWDDTSIDGAVDYFDAAGSNKVYAKIYFNSGDKISEIELSTKKAAWKDGEHYTEKEGTVASLKDGVLKFKSSSISYKMLSKYNANYDPTGKDDEYVTGPNPNGGGSVKNPLKIEGAVTSSLTVFEKLASSDDVEMVAKITADENNKVVEVEATLKSVTGKIVEYRIDDNEIELELDNGAKVNLQTTGSVDLTDEDEPAFTIEKIATKKYVGQKVKVDCNGKGKVDVLTVLDGYQDSVSYKKVKGIALAAADGLKVEGDSNTYRWLSRKGDIIVRNYSGPSESVTVIQNMIDDPDVKVYVEAGMDDKDRVENIRVYVKEAEGTIVSYDDTIVIRTAEGNKFAFDVDDETKISIGDFDEDDLEDGRADGKKVYLTFKDNGEVKEITE